MTALSRFVQCFGEARALAAAAGCHRMRASVGSFFTNVQVHVGGQEADSVRALVIDTVRERVLRSAFVCTGEGETPDSTLLVAPVGTEPWIAVYDQATESQKERAGALSMDAHVLTLGEVALARGKQAHRSGCVERRAKRRKYLLGECSTEARVRRSTSGTIAIPALLSAEAAC